MRAVVLEDRQGNRAVIAEAQFTITLATADFVSAELLRSYPLNRAAILLHSVTAGTPAPPDILTAIGAALSNLQPARVLFDGSLISIASAEGPCRAVLFPIAFAGCSGGTTVRPPIRSAFQVVEPEHGLQLRGELPLAYPVQAIAFGRQAAILALGGEAPASRFQTAGLIVLSRCNGNGPFPDGGAVAAAIRQVLARVGRFLPER